VKIFRFARKEFELVASQKTSLALVILYPALIVLVVALAFGSQNVEPQSGFERADVAYYLPFGSSNFDSEEFLDHLSQVERLRLHRAKSPDAVKEAIDQGIARIGVVVHEPTSEFERVKISFYYDNSAPLVSKMVMSYAYFSIQIFANNKSTKILHRIWENLDTITKRLDEQYAKINGFEEGLDGAKQRIIDLETKINSIDIASLKSKLNQFNAHYLDSKSKIASAKEDLAEAKTTLSTYRAKLVDTSLELSTYSDTLKLIRGDLQQIKNASFEPIKSQLQSVENELTETITKIDSSIAEINSAINDIDDSQQKLTELNTELNSADSKLDSANLTVEEFKVAVDDLETTLTEVKGLIRDSFDYYEQTKSNLAETKTLLDDLTETIEKFMFYKPEFLVRPFIVEENKMYLVSEEYLPVEKTAILIPISLTIVLMLTCILIASISTIVERKQGLNVRLHSSPTSKLSWVSGKILGQIMFALLEALIILAIAILVFGVPLMGSILDLLIVLVAISLAFISIGVFLTGFTSEQSTAVLASLLIMIPLLFLGGIIFPIEFMPFYVQGIASALPLTLGIQLLTNVMVKGIPLIYALDKLLVLVVPAFILLLVGIFRKKI
jgi:ABC-type multidrug transport system permease subunit/methyl-accepting chemotaxis protein